MTIYFAHDMRTYGTGGEKEALRRIAVEYPNVTIINPSTDIKQAKGRRTGRHVMQDCLKAVKKSSVVIFTAYEGKEIRNGVESEIREAWRGDIPVYWLKGGRFISQNNFEIRYFEHESEMLGNWWEMTVHEINCDEEVITK